MVGISERLRAHRQQIVQIVARHGGRNPRVFGSCARGQERQDSDVDILLALEPGRSLLDLVAIKQDLEDLLGCSVDVVTESSISPYVRERVCKEAVGL